MLGPAQLIFDELFETVTVRQLEAAGNAGGLGQHFTYGRKFYNCVVYVVMKWKGSSGQQLLIGIHHEAGFTTGLLKGVLYFC